MDATKLIRTLVDMVAQHGDLPVRFCNQEGYIAEVAKVEPSACDGERPFEFLLETKG